MRQRSLICFYNRPTKLDGPRCFFCGAFSDNRNKILALYETWGSAIGIRR